MILADQSSFWSQYSGNIITGLSIIVGLVYQSISNRELQVKMHTENRERLDALLNWQKDHKLEAAQRDKAIAELSKIAAALEASQEGNNRRLVMLEERPPWYEAEKTKPPVRGGGRGI